MQIVEFTADASLPVISSNFDATKLWLAENLKKYEIEVTQSNLAEAKKLATELNKIAKQIDDKKKERLKEIEAPIDIFKEQVKELVNMCQNGRAKINEQVTVFEDKTRALCLKLLAAELQEKYAQLNIKDEFKAVTVEDLAIISNVTDANNLAKPARDAIGTRVHAALSLQNRVHVRLVELDNASYAAKLVSRLERRHVETFLKELDDAVYDQKLQSLIQREVERQNEMQASIAAEERKKAEAEMQRKLEEEKKRMQEEERQRRLEDDKKKAEAEEKQGSSKIPTSQVTENHTNEDPENDTFMVTVTFKAIAPRGKYGVDSVKNSFVSKLATANFITVQSVDVLKLA